MACHYSGPIAERNVPALAGPLPAGPLLQRGIGIDATAGRAIVCRPFCGIVRVTPSPHTHLRGTSRGTTW